ncbi:hypothetical protein HK099_007763, partial [Clydaea vesicula]
YLNFKSQSNFFFNWVNDPINNFVTADTVKDGGFSFIIDFGLGSYLSAGIAGTSLFSFIFTVLGYSMSKRGKIKNMFPYKQSKKKEIDSDDDDVKGGGDFRGNTITPSGSQVNLYDKYDNNQKLYDNENYDFQNQIPLQPLQNWNSNSNPLYSNATTPVQNYYEPKFVDYSSKDTSNNGGYTDTSAPSDVISSPVFNRNQNQQQYSPYTDNNYYTTYEENYSGTGASAPSDNIQYPDPVIATAPTWGGNGGRLGNANYNNHSQKKDNYNAPNSINYNGNASNSTRKVTKNINQSIKNGYAQNNVDNSNRFNDNYDYDTRPYKSQNEESRSVKASKSQYANDNVQGDWKSSTSSPKLRPELEITWQPKSKKDLNNLKVVNLDEDNDASRWSIYTEAPLPKNSASRKTYGTQSRTNRNYDNLGRGGAY